MNTATQLSTPQRHGTSQPVPWRWGVRYYVNAAATRCSCKGFSYRGRCAHLSIVEAMLSVDTDDEEVSMG